MKLITYRDTARGERLAAAVGEGAALDLADAARQQGVGDAAALSSMLDLIRAGEPGLALARRVLAGHDPAQQRPMAGLTLLAPLPRPEQIRDFANYEKHVRQALASSMRLRSLAEADPGAAYERLRASGQFAIPPVWYERPLYYKGNRFSVVGHGADITWPPFARLMDYELELAVVIGRPVRDVDEAQAMDAVFGYTIYNDFSARDVQAQESAFRMGPAKGKDFDTGNAIGPCIVTRDEIADPEALAMVVRVNGQERCRTTSGGMQHGIARCIAFVSRAETLHPGELLAMGTVGDGCGYESLQFLEDGDTVELEIAGIGCLHNRLVRGKGTSP